MRETVVVYCSKKDNDAEDSWTQLANSDETNTSQLPLEPVQSGTGVRVSIWQARLFL